MAFRSYLALQYVQGEDVVIEFKVTEGECVAPLYDYTLEATVKTSCNQSFDFDLEDTSDDGDYFVARLSTDGMPVGRHKFELRQVDDNGDASTLLYGDLILLESRIG